MANIERFLPIKLREIEEFTEFCLAQNPEFDEVRELREKWMKNKFPWEADEDGIKVWEKILGIKPSINSNLESRRSMVIAKLNERLPYTYIQLHRMMAAICGWDGFDLKLKDFVLMAVIAMDVPERYAAVKDMLMDVLPAHIFILLVEFLEGNETGYLASHGWTKRVVSTHTAKKTQDILIAGSGRIRRIVETHTPYHPKKIYIAGTGITRKVVQTHSPLKTLTIYPVGWGRLIKQISTGNK